MPLSAHDCEAPERCAAFDCCPEAILKSERLLDDRMH